MAGLSVSPSPLTSGGVFDLGELRALFRRATLAMSLLDTLNTVPGWQRDRKLDELRNRLPPPRPLRGDDRSRPGNRGVVRFDLRFRGDHPADLPKELWLDHAIVHETSTSYRSRVLRHLGERNPVHTSYPFTRAVDQKKSRYSGVMTVASRLAREGALGFLPSFLFPVVSTLGHVNPDMGRVLDWILKKYTTGLGPVSERSDGMDVPSLKGRFRAYLRRALCFALVRGNSLLLRSQGRPGLGS